MKRFIAIVVFFAFVATASAVPVRKPKHSLVEFGPKANLYIGSVRFGIGAELIVNPLRNLGIRMDVAEFSFGNHLTEFHMNYGGSLDALIHFPAQQINPYFYGGFSLFSFDIDGFSDTFFTFRFGLGLEHTWDRNMNVFIEPGFMIADAGGETETIFRLSAGARLGLLR